MSRKYHPTGNGHPAREPSILADNIRLLGALHGIHARSARAVEVAGGNGRLAARLAALEHELRVIRDIARLALQE